MKVFTFYYNRYNSATTSIALKQNGIEHYVMVHSEKDLQKFNEFNTIQGIPIVTNQKKGLAFQRNCALDMVNFGEWCCFMCDDFIEIYGLPKEYILSKTNTLPINFNNQHLYRLKGSKSKLSTRYSIKDLFRLFPKLIQIAENNKIYLIGFGLHDNPLNLRKKFTSRGLADGRFWLIKKHNYKFDLNAQLIDDVAWTAENLVRHNNVLVLNWIVPYFKRYSSGGFGSTKERKQQRIKECTYLQNKFYPLVKIANKSGWDKGTHIKLFGTNKNISMARKRLKL